MTSNHNETGSSRPQDFSPGPVLEKDLVLHLEEYNLSDEEVRTLAEIDGLLRRNFEDIESGVGPVGQDRLSGIIEEVQAAPEIAVLKRTRRSIRLILWITICLGSLLAAYALIALVLKGGGF